MTLLTVEEVEAAVGMAGGKSTGMNSRLHSHDESKRKWTHSTVFEVNDNITRAEIAELEGLNPAR
jgi:hypothetical protein